MKTFKYKRNFIANRDDKIIELCKWKKVLHIWACDSPFTKERYEHGYLLFSKIEKVCKTQLWIDIDKEMIEFLNKKYGEEKIIYFDMDKLENLEFEPDIIIFGEVIEHLMNPGIALTNLKKIMKKDTILFISTPNAFYYKNTLRAIIWYEFFHEDHKLLFSMGYLENLLKFNDLIVENKSFWKLYRNFKSDFFIKKIIKKILYLIELIISIIFPTLSETLIITCKKK